METILSNAKLRVDIRSKIMKTGNALNCMTDKENKFLTVVVGKTSMDRNPTKCIEKIQAVITSCCNEAKASVPNLFKYEIITLTKTNTTSRGIVFNVTP